MAVETKEIKESDLDKLAEITSSAILLDAVANAISPLLAPIHKLFRESANGINTDVTGIVAGDSTNSIDYAKFQEYYKKQFRKLGVTYFDNSYSGQKGANWLNNIGNNTIQQAINASTGIDGVNTILIYSFGINDYDGINTEADIKNIVKTGIQAYLTAKPKANVIMLRPNRTSSNTRDTWLGNIYTQVAQELNLFLVDAYSITANKWGNPLYYFDTTHPNKWGARAIMNNTFAKIVPLDLMNKLTLEEEDGTNIDWSSYCLKANVIVGYYAAATGIFSSGSTTSRCLEEIQLNGGEVLVLSHQGERVNFIYMDVSGAYIYVNNPTPTNKTLISTAPENARSVRINITSGNGAAYDLLNDIPTLHKQTINNNIYCDLRTINAQQVLPNMVITTRKGITVDNYGKIGVAGQSLKIDANNKMKWSV